MKKEKTVKQQKNKYAAIQWSCFGGEFISVLAPFVAIAIVNYDKYFVEYNGTKMSIAFYLALGVMGLAILLFSKKLIKDSLATFVINWTLVAIIFTLMGEMITDIATIMWFGLIGIAGAYGLDILSKKAEKKKLAIKDAIATAEKDNMVEQYKEETKKIKVKVKKDD